MTEDKHFDLISKLKPRKIILPVLLGLAVVVWFIAKDIDKSSMSEITFTWKSTFWIFTAILLIVARTFGYMARIRTLTDNELTWMQSFRIIILWEFTSAITPSTVGGTAFAVIFLHKEGINVGRSTAVVLVTSFLDELYFVIMFPILILIVGKNSIFIESIQDTGWSFMNNIFYVALFGYSIILTWVLLVGYGLFFKPVKIKNLIISLFRLPVLRRWKGSAIKAGDDIITSSEDLKHKPGKFWFKACLYTFLSWTSRYWIANALLASFFVFNEFILIFARELVLWIIMIILPTPGGSGFVELLFKNMIIDLLPVASANADGVSSAIAVFWRLITYYPFLVLGIMIIPGWIARKFVRPLVKKQ